MNEKFNLDKNIKITVFAFISNIILVTISYKLLINNGGLKAVGLWSNLMAWIFIVRLGDVGMTNAAVRFASTCDTESEQERIKAYVDTALIMNIILFTVLAYLGNTIYSANIEFIIPTGTVDQNSANAILSIMFTGFFLQNASGTSTSSLIAIHRGDLSAWLTLTGTFIQLTIVFMLVPKLGIAGIAWAQVVQYAFTLIVGRIIFIVILNKNHEARMIDFFPTKGSIETIREIWVYSLKSQFINILNGIFEPLTKITIGRLGGLDLLGTFELAYKLVSIPRNAVVSGVQVSAPALTRLMRIEINEARVLYSKSLKIIKITMPIILISVTLSSPLISYFWLGKVSYDLMSYTFAISIGFYFNSIGAPAYVIGTASGNLRGNIISLLLSMIFLILATQLTYRFLPSESLVVITAAALAIAGISVKKINEPLLIDK